MDASAHLAAATAASDGDGRAAGSESGSSYDSDGIDDNGVGGGVVANCDAAAALVPDAVLAALRMDLNASVSARKAGGWAARACIAPGCGRARCMAARVPSRRRQSRGAVPTGPFVSVSKERRQVSRLRWRYPGALSSLAGTWARGTGICALPRGPVGSMARGASPKWQFGLPRRHFHERYEHLRFERDCRGVSRHVQGRGFCLVWRGGKGSCQAVRRCGRWPVTELHTAPNARAPQPLT